MSKRATRNQFRWLCLMGGLGSAVTQDRRRRRNVATGRSGPIAMAPESELRLARFLGAQVIVRVKEKK